MKSRNYLDAYAAAGERVMQDIPDTDHVFVQEGRNRELYHFNGQSALRSIVLSMINHDIDPPASFLDFGCAYGRVLRYVKAAFPDIETTAADIRPDAIAFCAETLGSLPYLSSPDLASIALPRRHDLIWMGSVITHFSSDDSKLLVDKMVENLNPGGLLVFSVHGRIYPLEVQPNRWKLLETDVFEQVEADYLRTGFGYADYPGRPGIGASLTKPSWVFEHLYADKTLAFSYTERSWMGWHDIVAIRKGPQRAYFDTYRQRPY